MRVSKKEASVSLSTFKNFSRAVGSSLMLDSNSFMNIVVHSLAVKRLRGSDIVLLFALDINPTLNALSAKSHKVYEIRS